MCTPARQTRIILMLAVCLAAQIPGCGTPDSSEQVRIAEKKVLRGDLSGVEQELRAVPPDDKAWASAQLLLGKMAARRRETEDALEFFLSIPGDGSPVSLAAAQLAAEIQMKNCMLSGAAKCYEYLAAQNPDDLSLKTLLASLLVIGGERSRADAVLMDMLYSGKISLKDLIMLTQRERQPPEAQHLLECSGFKKNDPLTLFALASADVEAGDSRSAVQKLQLAVTAEPECISTQALLGELLLEESDADELAQWARQVPVTVQTSPALWYLRGLLARRHQSLESAARCFWEAVRLDPLHRRAMFQLGQVLETLQPEAAEAFRIHAERIQDFSLRIERVLNAGGT